MNTRLNLDMDGSDVVEFSVTRGNYVYTFKGRIQNFELNTEREDMMDIDGFMSGPRLYLKPRHTFSLEGEVVGQIGSKLETPETKYASFPQRYVMAMEEALEETGIEVRSNTAFDPLCDHMCSCTDECKPDCPALCGD